MNDEAPKAVGCLVASIDKILTLVLLGILIAWVVRSC
jgi:hypothetical protein